MWLGADEEREYREKGFALLRDTLTEQEVGTLRETAATLLGSAEDKVVLEPDGTTVRSLYDAHRADAVFGRLIRDPRVLEPARQLLGSDVYIHQTQLNAKAAFDGESWDWHQDYFFWQRDDGMRSPRAANVVVYLDDMTMYNGPLFIVPGSHLEDFSAATATVADGWERTLTKDLKHTLSRAAIRDAVDRLGIASPLGPAGSVLLFDPRVVHGSPANISPHPRRTWFIRYNSIENALASVSEPRPGWLADRHPVALEPLVGGLLDAHR